MEFFMSVSGDIKVLITTQVESPASAAGNAVFSKPSKSFNIGILGATNSVAKLPSSEPRNEAAPTAAHVGTTILPRGTEADKFESTKT